MMIEAAMTRKSPAVGAARSSSRPCATASPRDVHRSAVPAHAGGGAQFCDNPEHHEKAFPLFHFFYALTTLLLSFTMVHIAYTLVVRPTPTRSSPTSARCGPRI